MWIQRTAPPDSPCAPTQGIETYCDSYGNAQTRPSGSSQNVNNLDEASDCASGETLNGNSCCVACPQTARPACTSGRSYTWDASQCRWIRSTVSRPSCGGQTATWDSGSCSWDCPNLGTETYCDSNGVAQERPASGTSDVDNLDKASDCTSSEELNSDSCCVSRGTQTYLACSNGVVTTEPWTRSGNPVNDDTATHFYCVGAVKHADLICASDDDDDLPTSCSSGYSLNTGGCCAQDTAQQTYQACSNGVLTTKPWTHSGSPVDDPVATRYFCIGATPDDEPICASRDRDDRPNSCGSGFSLNTSGCCAPDTEPQTYQACSTGVVTTKPWTRSGNPVNDPVATRYFCIGATPDDEPICASRDRDDRPNSCRTGYILNIDGCCEPDTEPQTYQACSDGVLTTKPWTRSGNPVDDDTATRYYCVGASARTDPICGSTDQRERPTRCSTGFSLNTGGCCAPDTEPQTYQACSDGVLTTKPWTGSGNPVDDDTATRYYCVGASARTDPICGSTDQLEHPDSCRTGYSLNSVDCCEQDPPPIPNGIETYCDSNGVAQEREAPGTDDVDKLDKVSDCTSRQTLNSDSCCVDLPPRGIESYCDSNGVAREREAPGTDNVNNLDEASDCTSRQTLNSDSCCVDLPPRGTERYCDSSGVAQERPAPGADNVNNLDKALDCTSRQILNSDSCCVPRGTKYYCDSSGDAQTSLAPGIADVNNLDKVSDCTSGQTLNSDSCCVDPPPPGRESYCDSNGVARERDAPGTDNVNNLDKEADCKDGESLNNQSCCVVCPPTRRPHCSEGKDWEWNTTSCAWVKVDVDQGACYNSGGYTYVYDTWLSTACDYTTTSSVDPRPASNACGSASWNTASCGWGDPPALPSRSGCPGTGLAWGTTINSNTCTYNTVAVTQPTDCIGTLEWERCAWMCPAVKITFSFPSVISEQTSQAATEQNLDLAFNSDGSITLVETLVGPNSTTRTSPGNWATGADVARVSEVVEYRLAGNNGVHCTGSSSWAAFSGLTVGVFGEAAVGQATTSCNYEFRNEDDHESIGSSRIQLSTQASSRPGRPGQMN